MERWMNRQIEREGDRQTDRQTDRQAGRFHLSRSSSLGDPFTSQKMSSLLVSGSVWLATYSLAVRRVLG